MKYWNKFENIVGVLMRGVASVCLGVVFALFILNISTRLPFITYNPKWIDETIQFFLVWMIFLGSAELVRTRGHFVVDILTDHFHGTVAGRVMAVISTALMLATYTVIFYFGVRLCMKSDAAMYTLHFMKKSYFYSCVPVSSFFMALFTIRDLIFSVMDIVTHGAVTRRLDAEKAEAMKQDDDAKAIAEAAEALQQEENPPE
ncbi:MULTISPECIES: TRAP transporter small permease [Anaerotruncus]|jgi:TRAP-type C4-dicarboxylate transport system permease small subunit|uniref:TRAP transporter small permease subunit n=1 Tax=Anaerotruncus colihominis TaxID=169435 RepID=A0A845RFG6_9FIRM|nr:MULTISPECIES: TRAP transporter small permease subunit [Anaerotruncus]MCI8491698.1 TRAP transporter small permease subunit [Anaerotruncus sp.]MCR2025932.1 TRAP transporter small permease subunit [Anaerotruncus colihominis]NBI77575.1 TRAP transporter small permease subunit [Anaerotruncus colihominis]NDO38517.1 TRAP transporter small permease subunit [Anaerotruncus colihominis]